MSLTPQQYQLLQDEGRELVTYLKGRAELNQAVTPSLEVLVLYRGLAGIIASLAGLTPDHYAHRETHSGIVAAFGKTCVEQIAAANLVAMAFPAPDQTAAAPAPSTPTP